MCEAQWKSVGETIAETKNYLLSFIFLKVLLLWLSELGFLTYRSRFQLIPCRNAQSRRFSAGSCWRFLVKLNNLTLTWIMVFVCLNTVFHKFSKLVNFRVAKKPPACYLSFLCIEAHPWLVNDDFRENCTLYQRVNKVNFSSLFFYSRCIKWISVFGDWSKQAGCCDTWGKREKTGAARRVFLAFRNSSNISSALITVSKCGNPFVYF